MKRIATVTALIAIVVVAIYFLIISLLQSDPDTRAAVIGLLSVVTAAIVTHNNAKTREINARHFAEKRMAYDKILVIMFDSIKSVKFGKSGTRKSSRTPSRQMVTRMMEFKRDLMSWGSPAVIDAWNTFEDQGMTASKSDPQDILLYVDRLMREIRKDLGHDDHDMKPGTLVGMILKSEDRQALLGD